MATRQSISFTEPNNDWLKEQIKSKEYSNKSDIVNDLIRKARKKQQAVENIREALILGEESGISDLTPSEIMEKVIKRKQKNGEI